MSRNIWLKFYIVNPIRDFSPILRVMFAYRYGEGNILSRKVLVIWRSACGIVILYHCKCAELRHFLSARARAERSAVCGRASSP